MKPGSMKKMGLDYEAFKAVKPDIIYCSISAFGQSGPKAKDPGFDILAQACSGIMDMTGERNGPPGEVRCYNLRLLKRQWTPSAHAWWLCSTDSEPARGR